MAPRIGNPILVKVVNTHDVITDAVVSLAVKPQPEYIAKRATRSEGPGMMVAAAEGARNAISPRSNLCGSTVMVDDASPTGTTGLHCPTR